MLYKFSIFVFNETFIFSFIFDKILSSIKYLEILSNVLLKFELSINSSENFFILYIVILLYSF